MLSATRPDVTAAEWERSARRLHSPTRIVNDEQIETLYAKFTQIFANGKPVRRAFELIAAVRAAGYDPETVSQRWLRTLDVDWVHGKSGEPFRDAGANRLYERFLRER